MFGKRVFGRKFDEAFKSGARLVAAALPLKEARIGLHDADRAATAGFHRLGIGFARALVVAKHFEHQAFMEGAEKREGRAPLEGADPLHRQFLVALAHRCPGIGQCADKRGEGAGRRRSDLAACLRIISVFQVRERKCDPRHPFAGFKRDELLCQPYGAVHVAAHQRRHEGAVEDDGIVRLVGERTVVEIRGFEVFVHRGGVAPRKIGTVRCFRLAPRKQAIGKTARTGATGKHRRENGKQRSRPCRTPNTQDRRYVRERRIFTFHPGAGLRA